MSGEVNGKRILSVDEMISAEDTEYAEIPTWKVKDPKTGELVQGYTRIGSLDAETVQKWRETGEGPAKRTMGIRLFVDSLVDEHGNRIGQPHHYEAFKKKSNAIQDRCILEVLKLNGLIDKDKDKPAKSSTEEAKND